MKLGSRIADRGWRWTAAGLVCLLPLGAAAMEINTATRAELEQLNGVGVAMAERVLAPYLAALNKLVAGSRDASVLYLKQVFADTNT